MAEIIEKATFTNMIMIEDGKGNVVVENRIHSSWRGLVFPGGHVERQEMFADSAVREAYEETGLKIEHPELVGVKQIAYPDGYRYVVFLFRADRFTGTLKSSEEGRVVWMPLEELRRRESEMCPRFANMLKVFLDDNLSEYSLVCPGKSTENAVEYLK